MEWFLDLNDTRRFTVVVGMGGGGCFPEALSHQEILSWAHLTRNCLTPWEVEVLRHMDQRWRLGHGQKKGGGKSSSSPSMRHQGLGEYCKGEDIESCRKQFGAQLAQICATCPD